MKSIACLSLISVATAAAVGPVSAGSASVETTFETPVGKAPEVSPKAGQVQAQSHGQGVKPNANPSPDTGTTYFTYRGWTGDHCDGSQNIDYEFTTWAFPNDLQVSGTHSVSFDNYGECRDIQCTFYEDGGNRNVAYHYHQGFCYNINTGWAIKTADCDCLYCNGNDCHT